MIRAFVASPSRCAGPSPSPLAGLSERESGEILEFLFAPQLQPEHRYTHRWTEGGLLVWDDIGALHNAKADYGPDEHRLIKRCRVMADRIFDRAFVDTALGGAA